MRNSRQVATPHNSSSILNDLGGLRDHSAILGFNHLDNHILFALGGAAVTAAPAEAQAAAISTAATISAAVTAGVAAGVAALQAIHGKTAIARCQRKEAREIRSALRCMETVLMQHFDTNTMNKVLAKMTYCSVGRC